MLALFLALTIALILLSWGELPVRQTATASPARGAPAGVAALSSARQGTAEVMSERIAAPAADMPQTDETIMARLADMLEEPAVAPVPEATAPQDAPVALDEDLPRIGDFTAGDVIELEVEGPAPVATDISFEQIGHDVCVLICGAPAFLLEGVAAATLGPDILKFRSSDLV